MNEASLAEIRRRGQAGTLNEFGAINNVAGNLMRMGEVRAAHRMYRDLLGWLDRGVFAVTPVGVQSNVGVAEYRLGNFVEALRLAEAEQAVDQKAGNQLPASLAELLASRALLGLGRAAEASARLDAAERFLNTNPRAYARMLSEVALHRAELQLASPAGVAGARPVVDALLASMGYPARDTTAGLDRALRLSARLHRDSGDFTRAAEHASAALAISRRIARDERASADVGEAALLRAQAYDGLDRRAEASSDADLAVAALTAGLGADHALTAAARRLQAALSGPATG